MEWYSLKVVCPDCKEPVRPTKLHYNARGELKSIGFCDKCGKEVKFITEADTLRTWAFHWDNPCPTKEDKNFLHDLRVKWNP